MTLYTFRLLSAEQQLRHVFTHGTFLTSRQEVGKETILYYLPDSGRGFFIELGIDREQSYFFVLRTFITSGPLAAYTQGIELPNA